MLKLDSAERVELSHSDYRQHVGLSQTELKCHEADPKLYEMTYITGQADKPERTKDMLMADSIDKLLLAGNHVRFPVLPREVLNKNGGRISKRVKLWESCFPGDDWLTPAEHKRDNTQKLLAKANIESTPKARRLLTGDRHVRIVWTDDETGIVCKSEIDFALPSITLGDLKVSAPHYTKSTVAWARHVVAMGWDIQMAHYRRAWYELTQEWLPWVWLVIRNDPTMGVCLFEASEDFMDGAAARWRLAMYEFTDNQESGVYESRNHGKVLEVDAPYNYGATA